jgi:hypothetical protein
MQHASPRWFVASSRKKRLSHRRIRSSPARNRPMKNFDAEDYSDAGHVTIRSTRNLLSGRFLLRDQGIPYIKRMPAFGESRRFAGTLMDKFGSTRA